MKFLPYKSVDDASSCIVAPRVGVVGETISSSERTSALEHTSGLEARRDDSSVTHIPRTHRAWLPVTSLPVGASDLSQIFAPPVAAGLTSTPSRFPSEGAARGADNGRVQDMKGITGAAKAGVRVLPATHHVRLEESLVELQALLEYARSEAHKAAGIASNARFEARSDTWDGKPRRRTDFLPEAA